MAVKFVSLERLRYFAEKIEGLFVRRETGKGLSANDLTDALKGQYDAAYTHAQKAHVYGVQKNGQDVAPDGEGKVNLTFGALADKAQVSEGDLDAALAEKVNAASEGNHSHANKEVLDGVTSEKVAAWDSAIRTVKVNGQAQSAANNEVNLTVPTTVAQLTDAGNYAKKTDIASVYKYMGSVENYAALPTEGQEVGHVYNVKAADKSHGIKAGDNVAWDGTAWDVLAGTVDLTGYLQTSDLVEVTEEEIDAMFA